MSAERRVLPEVASYKSSTGVRIYSIACDAFPGLVANIYLLLEAGPPTLVDTGSGFGDANKQLLAGLEKIRADFDEPIALSDIRRIVLTHGHIDHIGGLTYLHRKLPKVEIAIHELDLRILTNYEERVAVAKKTFRAFLQQAGVEKDLLPAFMDIYGYSKKNVNSLPVTHPLVDGQELDGLRFIHTPGHCPGQVCIGLGNVVLSADHILPEITPHQAPESIMPYTGLGHYLESLDKMAHTGGFDLGLGGHGPPIREFYKRVAEIRESHVRKLDKISVIIRDSPEPLTTSQISKQLYTHVMGFHTLLALEEVAAHVEYLYQHGKLAIANLDQYQSEDNPAIRYVLA